MIPPSFTASVNFAAFRMTTCLTLTLFQALRFSTLPTPSTAPLPWDVANKFQLMLEACFSSDISINLAMNLFLDWLLGHHFTEGCCCHGLHRYSVDTPNRRLWWSFCDLSDQCMHLWICVFAVNCHCENRYLGLAPVCTLNRLLMTTGEVF